MYVNIVQWRDLEDGHLYNAGEPFPHDGREISEDRIKALTCAQNKAGFAVIKAVEVKVEEKPIEKAEEPKKTVRKPKKG